MTIEAAKALVRSFYENDFIRNDPARLADVFSPNFVDHDPPRPDFPPGIDGVRAVMTMLAVAFPNRRIHVFDVFGEGDRVALRFAIQGTQEGPFAGMPPSGQERTLNVIAILRVEGGRIIERWGRVEIR